MDDDMLDIVTDGRKLLQLAERKATVRFLPGISAYDHPYLRPGMRADLIGFGHEAVVNDAFYVTFDIGRFQQANAAKWTCTDTSPPVPGFGNLMVPLEDTDFRLWLEEPDWQKTFEEDPAPAPDRS